ncbi:MAG: TRAP transporter substrate-binding protein [Desulfobacterales bacterium]|nr:TRAP transporter substrate-binding protein [Desulfobacterales bacterium]
MESEKFSTRLTIIMIVFALILSSGPAMAGKTLILGECDTVGSLINRTNKKFVELATERADGKIKINHIAGSQLGNDVQVIEQMMQGAIQMYGDVLAWYANWENGFNILNWGFTFDGPDHVQRFIDSPIFEEIAGNLRDSQGIHILAAAPTQPRILFANKRINSPADLTGLKMRVPDIRTYVLLWQTLGTRPSRVAWSEVFLGLKTGTVEAAEGPSDPASAQKFHVAAPKIMLTNHVMSTIHVGINAKVFDSLDTELQGILTQAAKDAVSWARTEAQKSDEAVLAKMKAEGATLYDVDTAPFAEKAKSGVETMEKDGVWPKGLWEKIRAL